MKIVIAGAGEVGSHLAMMLSFEDQDITVVDTNHEHLGELNDKYNLRTVEGNPTMFTTLRDAGADQCDLFIAVMPTETNNIVSCSMAKSLGAKRTVARIENFGFMEEQNKDFVRRMGVDRLIYPEYLAACEIRTALYTTWARNWFEILGGEIIVVGVKLRDDAPIVGMQLKEFASTNHQFHVSAIKRGHDTIIPGGSDYLLANDIIYVTFRPEHSEDLIRLCGKRNHNIRNVMIMGGSKIAVRLIALCGDDFDFNIVEKDINQCRKLTMKCPDAEIFLGDARDPDVMHEAGIDRADAFIALSASSESNILACLTAKESGVKKSIAEVEDLQFVAQAEGLNIGKIINKKLLASSAIFQMLLDSDASTSKCLAHTDAEVAELEVKPGSRITRSAVKDLKLSREMTLAGLVRQGKGELVNGNTQFQPGDHVVVFCLAGSLHKIEKLFN